MSEDEAFFLFIIWTQEINARYEKDLEIKSGPVYIKRAAMHRRLYDGEHAKRLSVDFDPLTQQMCFFVACFLETKDGPYVCQDIIKPVGITSTEEEAKSLAAKIAEGGWRNFVGEEKKPQLHKVEVYNVLVTRN